MRQITFASQPSFEKYARSSRREQFLQSMEAVVPWSELKALIEPHYPKAGKGRQPVGLGIMLRIYFLQHWFNLSNPVQRMRSTSRLCCAALLVLIWAVRQRPTRPPS